MSVVHAVARNRIEVHARADRKGQGGHLLQYYQWLQTPSWERVIAGSYDNPYPNHTPHPTSPHTHPRKVTTWTGNPQREMLKLAIRMLAVLSTTDGLGRGQGEKGSRCG